MSIYALAFPIGVVTGLRSMTGPAVVSAAVRRGELDLRRTPLAFLGYRATPYVLGALAAGELVADKLPQTPSRKMPASFAARVVLGAGCGAALGAPRRRLFEGLIAGALGAIAGTLAGYELRTRAARAAGKDLPVALVEDAIAAGGAWYAVSRAS
jgi:uncharacterized membrane protein